MEECIDLAKKALIEARTNPRLARKTLSDLYYEIKLNPEKLSLGDTEEYLYLSTAFSYMFILKIFDETNEMQLAAEIGYLISSYYINHNPNENNLFATRILIMNIGYDAFKYSINDIFPQRESIPISRQAMFQRANPWALDAMQISDLYTNLHLTESVDVFKEIKDYFDKRIEYNEYNKSLNELIQIGKDNHKTAYNFFHNKLIVEKDFTV